jgi:hypothetical protein
LLGVSYRTAVGFAFIVALGAVLLSARADRRQP